MLGISRISRLLRYTIYYILITLSNIFEYFYFISFLVIQLNSEVLVTGFTMEHIPKMLAPNGQIDSAPNSFSVWVGYNEKNSLLHLLYFLLFSL